MTFLPVISSRGTLDYDEYGNITSSQGSITQPFQYTGEQYDPETGLVYLRARYYEPTQSQKVDCTIDMPSHILDTVDWKEQRPGGQVRTPQLDSYC